MLKPYIEQLMDFNYWGNGLILKYAEKLGEDVFIEHHEYGRGGLSGILSHVMFAEWIWLDRMEGTPLPVDEMRQKFVAENYPNVASLYEDWFPLELRMRQFLAKLPEKHFSQEIPYTRSNGTELSDSIADIVTQLVFHGMQHRSECALILTEKGESPGNLDYLTYLRP